MKTLKLLNKKNFLIIFFILIVTTISAEEKPIDIWNIDKKEIDNNSTTQNTEEKETSQLSIETDSNIYKMQSEKEISTISQIDTLSSEDVKIVGLYDPEDNGLDIDMWLNSDGDQLKNIFTKLNKIQLSEDASQIMKISLLTNAHPPKKNLSEKEFLNLKSDWLIQNSDLELIEEYLIKNQVFNSHPKLVRYLVDKHLSEANVEKVCEILEQESVEYRLGTAGGGNQARQPYLKNYDHIVSNSLTQSNYIHEYGLYVGNHTDLSQDQIYKLCKRLNNV